MPIVGRQRRKGRRGIAQDEPTHQVGAAQGHVQGDEPAKGMPEDHRCVDPQQVAQGGHVIGHLLKGAGFYRRAIGPDLFLDAQLRSIDINAKPSSRSLLSPMTAPPVGYAPIGIMRYRLSGDKAFGKPAAGVASRYGVHPMTPTEYVTNPNARSDN